MAILFPHSGQIRGLFNKELLETRFAKFMQTTEYLDTVIVCLLVAKFTRCLFPLILRFLRENVSRTKIHFVSKLRKQLRCTKLFVRHLAQFTFH